MRYKEMDKEQRKEYHRNKTKRWRMKNPERWRELHKIGIEKNSKAKRNAWKNDYRLKEKECFFCKGDDRLEFHHTNYKKHKGITLCFKCHRKIHNIIKREGNK